MTTTITEYSQTEAALAELRGEYKGVQYQVRTTDGLKEAKDGRAVIRGYRTGLETMRKALKAPALERSRLIDAEAKRITKSLLELEAPIAEQIKEEEARKEKIKQDKIDAEVKRVSEINERIGEITNAIRAVNCMGLPESAKVKEFIKDVAAIEVNDTFEEFEEQAHAAKDETLAQLEESLIAACAREEEARKVAAERVELAKLREADNKRAEDERKRLAEENTRLYEENEKKQAKEREEIEAQRKKIVEEQAGIDAEKQRLADDAAERMMLKRKKEEAEAEAKDAASREGFPGVAQVIRVVAQHYRVPEAIAKGWIKEICAVRGEK